MGKCTADAHARFNFPIQDPDEWKKIMGRYALWAWCGAQAVISWKMRQIE